MMRHAVALAGLAGCLEVPSGPVQECVSAKDCDAGEVCTEGLCYGAPPEGTFAATISAPSSRDDVVASELAAITLPQDGWLGEIQLETPVTISGRVEAHCDTGNQSCSTLSIGAQIRLTRPSRIPGAPALRFSVQSKPDLPRGTDSFTIRVPRTLPSDQPWSVTIDPEGGGVKPPSNGATEPAELVPPRKLSLSVTDDLEHQTYTLGGPDQIAITGNLRDAFQNPLTKYRVVALGRWVGETNATEVSTVDFSTDGSYSITLAENVMPPLEIVATPFEENDISPTLRLQDVDVVAQQATLTQPSGLGQPKMIDIPIEALTRDEGVKNVSGVRVIVTAEIESSFSQNLRAVFRAETTTAEDGIAHLALLDGPNVATKYELSLVPPASSTYGVIDNSTLDMTEIGPIRLPARVALSGTVVDIDGVPQAAISVTARRSQRFLWSVEEPFRAFLDEIPAATALTADNGTFVIWVDPAIAGTWANYDLFLETPAGSSAPNWLIREIALPRLPNPGTIALETITLPDAARMAAKVVDAGGAVVEGSDLRLFQISSNDNLCMEVGYPPELCPPATVVLGHGESDDKGKVTLTLPRP
jgi:hypothetical protein